MRSSIINKSGLLPSAFCLSRTNLAAFWRKVSRWAQFEVTFWYRDKYIVCKTCYMNCTYRVKENGKSSARTYLLQPVWSSLPLKEHERTRLLQWISWNYMTSFGWRIIWQVLHHQSEIPPHHLSSSFKANIRTNSSSMLARVTSNSARRRVQHSLRPFATVEKTPGGAIGTDGRHEIWRGDVDHDNEPKVS